MRIPAIPLPAVPFRARGEGGVLHVPLMLCSFALAAYAGVRLFSGDVLGIALWFIGAAVLHDMVLLPLYATADRALRLAAGTGRTAPDLVNHVRVPAFVSGTMLLVWLPRVLGRESERYESSTALPAEVFWERWLLITAVLFAVSGILLALRRRRGMPKAARSRQSS